MTKKSLLLTIKSFPVKFWQLNLLMMIERLTYAALVLQMAVYISQKDLPGGLHWDHNTKGIIFFTWAIVQNLTPAFFGALADKFGRKNLIICSSILIFLGYIAFGFQHNLYPFIFTTIVYGIGAGLFKPSIQSWISQNIPESFESTGWGINVMLTNFAVFFSPILANSLQAHSWLIFFIGCGFVYSINLIIVIFLKDGNPKYNLEIKPIQLLAISIKNLTSKKILFFILTMSGFTMIYMQFYETLPNFLYDWVDTSSIVKSLNLPKFMQMETTRGMMIDFKWLYNINSGLIVIFVVFISWLLSRIKAINGLILGVVLSTLGLFIAGFTQFGLIGILGMAIYTFGEMITNPKFIEYISKLSDKENKSMYLGFLNVSMAIGLSVGSLLGGFFYKNLGDKYTFSLKYIQQFYPSELNVTNLNSYDRLMELKSLNSTDLTSFLWNYYHPQYTWIPFLIIGLASAFILFIYSKKFLPK